MYAFNIETKDDDYQVDINVYDAAGKAYPATEANEDKVQAATETIVALLNKREALEARLAGQAAPEPQELVLPRLQE